MEDSTNLEIAYWHNVCDIVGRFGYAECPKCGKDLNRHGILPGISGMPSLVCLNKGENHVIEETHHNAEKAATTEQGLDPMSEHLAEIGIPASVVQTGGYCMVIFVYLTDDKNADYIGITRSERDEPRDDNDGWLVCLYQGDDEPTVLSWDATRDETVEIIRRHMRDNKLMNKLMP